MKSIRSILYLPFVVGIVASLTRKIDKLKLVNFSYLEIS